MNDSTERLIMDQWDRDSLIEKEGCREEYLLERISDLEDTNDDLKDKIDDLEYDLKLAKDTLQEFKNKIKDCLEEEYLNESL